MKVRLIEEGSRRELFRSPIHTRVKYRADTTSSHIISNSLHISELRFSKLNYLLLDLESKHLVTLNLAYTQTGYLLCIVIEGDCSLLENEFSLSAHQYLCLSMHESVEIKIELTQKILLVAIDAERAEDLRINNNEIGELDATMHSVLKEIQQCSEECPIKCIFIESKILSLVHLIFESLQVQKDIYNAEIGLSYEDIQKLRAAKVYIVENIDKSYTLIDLAHQVGLNDFKLKKGFRQLFGSTVFTYRHTMRMEKAKDMLRSGFQVNQVSDAIGYKHPHHFSTAFKEYFKVLPSSIKVKP